MDDADPELVGGGTVPPWELRCSLATRSDTVSRPDCIALPSLNKTFLILSSIPAITFELAAHFSFYYIQIPVFNFDTKASVPTGSWARCPQKLNDDGGDALMWCLRVLDFIHANALLEGSRDKET